MAVHIARVDLMHVTSGGAVKKKSNMTIGEVARATHEHRIIENTHLAPNSVGNPTIENYIAAEYDDGFKIKYMDQYIIITDNI